MKESGLTLVVGATGVLGTQTIRLLSKTARPVRALVRSSAAEDKQQVARQLATEVVTGDLKDNASLSAGCRGASVVISTATAVMSPHEADSIQAVDEDGQLALIEAAEAAGVKHFVHISFPPVETNFALQRAKRRVEQRLRESRMSFTILQPANFSEVWLSAAAGFDPARGTARILGTGEQPVSWMSVNDVARFAVAAADGGPWSGLVLQLGGPDPLTLLQVVKIFEELGGPRVVVEHVPESALAAQLSGARNAKEEAFAAIALSTARGLVVDPRRGQELLPGRLSSVREYASEILKASK